MAKSTWPTYPTVDEASKRQLLHDPVRWALGIASAPSAQLTAGTYTVWADVPWFMSKQGGAAVAAAVATSAGLAAYQTVDIYVRGNTAADADDYVAGILAAGTGNAFAWKWE
jgi:hypothetical protein